MPVAAAAGAAVGPAAMPVAGVDMPFAATPVAGVDMPFAAMPITGVDSFASMPISGLTADDWWPGYGQWGVSASSGSSWEC
jgi:hypothetical protein